MSAGRGVKSLLASVETSDAGGFTAIASTPTLDRDGEVLASGCFVPLPPSVPVHVAHNLSAGNVIGRAMPFYVGSALHIDATLASTADAQLVRTKLAEGVLDAISVVFRGLEWEQLGGTRTCVRAELLAADVVSIPSQPEARVLSVRGYQPAPKVTVAQAKAAIARARLAMVEHDLAEAKRILATYPERSARRRVAAVLRQL